MISSPWRVVTLAALLVALTSAVAVAKPQIGILGLEVSDPSGNIDQASTTMAKNLTDGLRNAANRGEKYTLGGGNKELLDEKLLAGCDDEKLSCMASIGANMKVDVLLYGRLEKAGNEHTLTLSLLNVKTQRLEGAKAVVAIRPNERDASSLGGIARNVYNQMTGGGEAPTLKITTNVERGTVLVDGNPKGTIRSGTATIQGLGPGTYRIAIEAEGFKRAETTVTMTKSGDLTRKIELEELPVTAEDPQATGTAPHALDHTRTGTRSSDGSSAAKYVFWPSGGMFLVSGGFMFYSWKKGVNRQDEATGKGIDSGLSLSCPAGTDKELCKYHKWTVYGGIGMGVFGAAALVSGYFVFFSKDEEQAVTPAGTAARRKRKPPIAIVPIVSPEGGGATVRIDF
ncbi:MAG: PEGA domain-containing protein [Kofleriaceae bacterium]